MTEPTSPGDEQPMTPAERMRGTRERRRQGLIGAVGLPVRVSEVNELVRRGLLAASERDDRGAIANSIGELLDRILGEAS